MKINLLDLFSGIGGFSLGLKQAGFEINKHFYSEVDKHAIAIYKHQFEDAEYVGSVTDVRGAELPRINAITFGSPCQDFSLAGKRKGMEGERSSLISEAIRLIAECRPDFFIWENVKGTFSSNAGADFWAIIQAFADIGGYRLEWQLLNTAWVLPQNRERIYLVGRLANRSAREIFPIEEDATGIQWKKKRFQRKVQADKRQANCITSRLHKMAVTDNYIKESKNNIKKVGQINSSQDGQIFSPKGHSQCLSAGHGNVPKIQAGTWRDFQKDEGVEGFREIKSGNCPTIPARAREDGSDQPVVKITQKARGFNKGGDHDICPTISTSSFEQNNFLKMGAIRGRNPENPKSRKSGLPTEQMIEINENDQKANCLSTVKKDSCVVEPERIRRLTEIECERLQGFPDNHTQYGNYDGEVKRVSATQRYKCLGNAVTVDVVEVVGRRLLECLAD